MMRAIRLTAFVVAAAIGVPPALVVEADARPRVARERRKARPPKSRAVRKRKKIAPPRAPDAAPAVAAAVAAVPAIPVPPETRAAVAPLDIPEGATAERRLAEIERRLDDVDAVVARAQAHMDDLKATVLQPKRAGEAATGGAGPASAPSI